MMQKEKEIPSHLRRFTQEDRIEVITEFGENLAKLVFGGRRLRHHHPVGDVFHLGIGYYIDAKMTGSNSSIRIPESQLIKHYDQGGRHGHAYAFIPYSNLDKHHKAQINKLVKGPKGLVRFLARRSKKVFLIDTTILLALYEKLGAQTYRMRGGYHSKFRPRQLCFAVRRKILESIASGDEVVLSKFDITKDSYNFETSTKLVMVGPYRVKLLVHKVLLKKEVLDDSFDVTTFQGKDDPSI
ncbi:MAG: hypothetical protein KBC81_00975 [Candidatus Pacebacteria bacterium]|nr:hypothetical protein [Candidatus Paceibacterota bacterium]